MWCPNQGQEAAQETGGGVTEVPGEESASQRLSSQGPPRRVALLGMEWFGARPGGLDRYLASLQAALAPLGVETSRVVLGPAPIGLPGLAVVAGMTAPLPTRLASYWWKSRGLNVDIVDAHFALYAAVAMRLSPLASSPLVVHFHGPWADESNMEGRLGRLDPLMRRGIEKAVYRRARELVVLSSAFRRVLVESYGVSPWKVHVIPPGVDLKTFSPEGRGEARASLGFSPEDRLVLTVRRLTARMGLPVLLDAWARLGPLPTRRILAVAGEGPLHHDLASHAARLGIAHEIRFLGSLEEPELARWYRAADLTVVPSLALEGFGLVVLESLASGTPVVVTDVGGLPEALEGLDPSLVVRAGDESALSERLEAGLAGGVPARDTCRRYAQSFSWERAARANVAVYRRALDPNPERAMRVVYLDHTARLSGGELALVRLLPALESVDAHVILGEDGPLVGRLLRSGVSVEVLPMHEAARGLPRDKVRATAVPVSSLVASTTYIARLYRRLRRLRPDLVHTNSLKATVYGGASARMAGIPWVWHLHDRIATDYLPGTAVRGLRALGRRLPTTVMANSSATLASLGLRSGQGHVVANPVEVATPMRPERGPRDLRVGIVGRIAPWKGQHLFLSAFARAFPYGTERAVVVGDALFDADAGYAHSLVRLAQELGIAPRVEFRGFVENVGSELARLDVLVHASTVPEPFGQVVVEGMAAGLAVVAANAGGPSEIVTDEVDGLLYPIGDAHALTRTLVRLAVQPELRQRLGRGGRIRALDFSPRRIAPQVLNVYQQVLGLGPNEKLVGR